MPTASELQITMNLAFPKAGVVFAINVASNGQSPSFRLGVTDISGRRAIPFDVSASPQLADWVRGYTRWLVRANVKASYSDSAITGAFNSGLKPEQVLQGVRDACDIIRQRFELYQESILV